MKMSKSRVTKTKLAKLLTRMKRSPMTHKQVVQFLLKGVTSYDENTRKWFDPTLYSSDGRVGLFEKYCTQLKDGRYRVRYNRKLKAPFTSVRDTTQPYDYNSSYDSYGW
jgi:hypothetical protein